MSLSIYSYIRAFEVGLCIHKTLLCLVVHIYRYCNVSTMASSAIMLFQFSVNDDGGILLHSWSPIKLLILRQCNVTRASYNYDPQSNGSCGHHFFHIKTRSSAEHSKIASREHFKKFLKSFSNKTRLLAFLCQTWYQEKQSDPSFCSTKFYLGGE